MDDKNREIDIEEYNYVIVNDILINTSNSFIQEDNLLKLENNNNSLHVSSFLQNKEFKYISYLENNVQFSLLPFKQKLSISSDYNYKIQFIGEKDDSILVSMCIVFYSEREKLNVTFINLNEEKIIEPNPHAKFYRLGIRIEGSGTCDLRSIKMYKVKRLDFMNFSMLRKLGFDTPNSIADLKVACVFDKFTTECYKNMCKLIEFTPYNWKAVLSIDNPHILIVESAWQGFEESWNRKVAYYNEDSIKQLKELTQWCKENFIPTVFWNKEDPVHFNAFIETCKYFDYIFTTERSCIEMYKMFLQHDRVYFLPFAAQPKIHNPIKITKKRQNKICYAGSYHAAKFKERQEDFDKLFNVALEYGIDIYDRNFMNNNAEFKFPEKCIPFIKGSLKPEEIQKAYKGYKVAINVTSAKKSENMFSRRVFELIASYTPIISSYSNGIKRIFGDLITASDDMDELKRSLNLLMKNEEVYNRIALRGLRLVLKEHTYEERLNYILQTVNINISHTSPKVSVISIIKSIEEFKVILEEFNSQSYSNKELLVLIDKFDINEDIFNHYNIPNIKVLFFNSLNKNSYITDIINGEYISYFSYSNYYGKYFLEDLMLALKYSNSSIIGKKSCYKLKKNFNSDYKLELQNKEREFEYVESLEFSSCIIDKNIFKLKKIQDIISELTNDTVLQDYFRFGYRLFSIDKYNFILNYNHKLKNKEILKYIEF